MEHTLTRDSSGDPHAKVIAEGLGAVLGSVLGSFEKGMGAGAAKERGVHVDFEGVGATAMALCVLEAPGFAVKDDEHKEEHQETFEEYMRSEKAAVRWASIVGRLNAAASRASTTTRLQQLHEHHGDEILAGYKEQCGTAAPAAAAAAVVPGWDELDDILAED